MEMSLDGADRFLIPKNLMEYIQHSREVILKGELDCIQIWSESKFNEFINGNLSNMHQYSIEVSNYLNELERNQK